MWHTVDFNVIRINKKYFPGRIIIIIIVSIKTLTISYYKL